MTTYSLTRIGAGVVLAAALGLAAGCLNRPLTPSPEEAAPDETEVEDAPAGKPLKEVTPQIREVVEAGNAFATDLYALLSKENEGESLFFSPYSISSALTMLAEGARRETAAEMGKALRFPGSARRQGDDAQAQPWDMERIHTALSALNDHFASGSRPASRAAREKLANLRRQLQQANQQAQELGQSEKWQEAQKAGQKAEHLASQINQLQPQYNRYELRIANALWGEKTYAFRKEYLDTLHKHYATGGLFPVDFLNDSEGSRQRINQWVEKQTRDRIKDMIPPGAVDQARLVLTNAIYFKGEWSEVFSKEQTREESFFLPDGKKARVPLMSKHLEGGRYAAFRGDGSLFDTPTRVPAGENDPKKHYPDDNGFQMLELPYKGDQVSMVVLVPRSPEGLAALEKKLTGGSLQKWIGRLHQRETEVFLPRFKLEKECSLERLLPVLGMKRVFNSPLEANGAQLDGISASQEPSQKLWVSKVLHKAFVEVNEKGTEAAAATAIIGLAGAAPPVLVPFIPVVRADRPFVFLIRDQKTGSILFLGRMLNPR